MFLTVRLYYHPHTESTMHMERFSTSVTRELKTKTYNFMPIRMAKLKQKLAMPSTNEGAKELKLSILFIRM